MTFMTASDGCSLHYRFDGPGDRPVVMLSNSLGSTLAMWEPQMAALTQRYRVLRYDNRGHGQSGAPEGPYTIDRIATDASQLIEGLGLAPVLFCGLSMGGMVGMWLAANAAHTLRRAVLANTSALLGPPEIWNQRIAIARTEGMETLAEVVVQRWLTAPYMAARPALQAELTAMIASHSVPGYCAAAAAVRDMDLRTSLSRIALPVLVIGGTQDPATPLAMSEDIAGGIPGARLTVLEAAHLSNIERADEFNRAILEFFDAA